MTKIRSLAEITIGVFYAIGAANQAFDVLDDSSAFYTRMAEQAWLPPAEWFIETLLIPNSDIVTIMVVLLEASLAVAILTRGPLVRPALMVGGLFSVAGALTGSPIETLGYGTLAVIHFWLAAKHETATTKSEQAV